MSAPLPLTPELFWLLVTAALIASLWIPYIVGVNTTAYAGTENTFVRPPDHRLQHAWVHRAHRAHLNAVEQFTPFATIVLVGALMGVTGSLTTSLVLLFLGLRIVHAVGMIAGFARMPLRPLLFTGGWAVTVAYAVAVLFNP